MMLLPQNIKSAEKSVVLLLSTVAFSMSLLAGSAQAATGINKQLNYQGKLTNGSGAVVADGSYNMIISLYTASSGGTPVWTARGTTGTPTARSVAVANGIFSIMLGDTVSGDNALAIDFSQDAYYLGITVGTDAEMTPRKRIGAVPQAFNSEMINGTSVKQVTGDPNGTQVGSVGDVAIDSTNSTLYIKVSGSGTDTGWSQIVAGGAVSSIGALDSQTKSANGAVISGNSLVLQSADASNPGLVTTGAQTFAGVKTFSSAPVLDGMAPGSIMFAGESGVLSQDNANLFYDTTGHKLGIDTASPSEALSVNGIVALANQAGTYTAGNTSGYSKIYTKAATGDGYDNYTKLLLHTDGANESTSFVDSSTQSVVVTSVNGAAVSTANQKFGTGSVFLNGTNQYLTAPKSTNYDIVSGQAFTFDAWFNTNTVIGTHPIFTYGSNVTNTFHQLRLNGNRLEYILWNGGGSAQVDIYPTNTITAGTWYHVAVVKDTNTTANYYLYLNGTQIGTASSNQNRSYTGLFDIGSNQSAAGSSYWDGYLDEIRYSTGVMRYNGNFTPNTDPYGTGIFYHLSNGDEIELGGGGGGSSSGANTSLSGLLAATTANSINNANYAQTWNWNTLTSGTAMTMSANTITSGTVLNLSNTGTTGEGSFVVVQTGSNSGAETGNHVSFRRPDGTVIGSIAQNAATTVAYNTTSDERLKNNIVDTHYGVLDLMQIKVRDFDYNNDPEHRTMNGFVAQELAQIYPGAVTIGNDEVDENGNLVNPWSVDYGKLTPLIIKSIQDQQTEIAASTDIMAALDMRTKNIVSTEDGKTVFKGMVMADTIEANKIIGLDVVSGHEMDIANAELTKNGQTLGDITAELAMLQSKISHSPSSLNLEELSVKNGALFQGAATFEGPTIFKVIAEFLDKTIFNGDVEFQGKVELGSDTIGTLTIPKDKTRVKVIFAKPFEKIPIIILTPKERIPNFFVVKDITLEGFIVELSPPETKDTTFSWTAFVSSDQGTKVEVLPDKKDESVGQTNKASATDANGRNAAQNDNASMQAPEQNSPSSQPSDAVDSGSAAAQATPTDIGNNN